MRNVAVEILFLAQRFHDELLQIFGKQRQPVLIWEDHHIFRPLAVCGVIPHQRQKHCRILGRIRRASPLIHGCRASEKIIYVETFQRHREKSHRAHD